jgi:hypothetical protein
LTLRSKRNDTLGPENTLNTVLAKQSERQYYDFFASPTPRSTGGWSRVDLLTDARRGDIMAWRSPTVEAHVDTGHVVILAETPTLDASGAFYVVRSTIPPPRRISTTPRTRRATFADRNVRRRLRIHQFESRGRRPADRLSLCAARRRRIFLSPHRHRTRPAALKGTARAGLWRQFNQSQSRPDELQKNARPTP